LEEAGIQRLAIGKATIRYAITEEEAVIEFAVLHLGDHNFIGGVRQSRDNGSFSDMSREIKKAFCKSDIAEIIRLMDVYFEAHNYSMWHLFKDEQRKIFNRMLEPAIKETEASFRRIYERHFPVMQAMTEMRIPLPEPFAVAAQYVADNDIIREIQKDALDFEKIARLMEETQRFSLDLDRKKLGFTVSRKINALMRGFAENPEEATLLETIARIFDIFCSLNLELDLWAAQNVFFSIGKSHYDGMEKKAGEGDENARKWIEIFDRVAECLSVESD